MGQVQGTRQAEKSQRALQRGKRRPKALKDRLPYTAELSVSSFFPSATEVLSWPGLFILSACSP